MSGKSAKDDGQTSSNTAYPHEAFSHRTKYLV